MTNTWKPWKRSLQNGANKNNTLTTLPILCKLELNFKVQTPKNSRQIFEVDDRKAWIYGEHQERLDEAAD